MGFFSKLFGSQKKDNNANSSILNKELPNKPLTPKVNISYKENLVDSLKNDHQKLFEIYGELINLTNSNDFLKIPGKLGELKLALQAHVLVENVHFYVYVQEKHKDDPINSEFIHDVRKDMNTIARVVVDFVKKYQMKVFTNEVKVAFFEELNAIGDALTKRIDMEEAQLYTLYTE